MLSAYQCEVVAFETPDGLVCAKCVRNQIRNDVYYYRCLDLLDDWPTGLSPVIRYSVDECAFERECSECGQTTQDDVLCDECGEEIS